MYTLLLFLAEARRLEGSVHGLQLEALLLEEDGLFVELFDVAGHHQHGRFGVRGVLSPGVQHGLRFGWVHGQSFSRLGLLHHNNK